MHVTIVKRVFNRMTEDELAAVDRTQRNLRGADSFTVSLNNMNESDVATLRAAFVRRD